MDFKEFEKLIPSLVPIILIIVVSWVFSFLAAKMRKAQPQTDESAPADRREDLLGDFLNLGKGAETFPGSQQETAGRPGAMPPTRVSDWRSYKGLEAPRITSAPIRPKWWGA
jgi:hypothetical protein